ncbi:MAG: hypothetical protein KDA68_03330 [Planctomycetaceae bacterium]|nr:hypothetical protein [Planctomycetaceae bacterium]
MFPSCERFPVRVPCLFQLNLRPTRFHALIPELACLACILSIVGCGKSTPSPQPVAPTPQQVQAASISRVLAEDRQQSAEAQNFEEIPQKMRRIDLSGCPNEFKAAYLAHIHAWEAAVQVLIEAKQFQKQSNSSDAFVESMLRSFMGDPFGKIHEVMQTNQELQRRYQTAHEGIQTSYHRVEELAVLFGAQLLPPQTAAAQ